jgi:hypothetical protein
MERSRLQPSRSMATSRLRTTSRKALPRRWISD